MTVSELILKLQELELQGYGDLSVCYDFGACKVGSVEIENQGLGDEHLYCHLDWV